MYFLTPLVVLNFGCLLYALYLCYITQDMSSNLAEGRWVTPSILSIFQILILAIPILIIIENDNDSYCLSLSLSFFSWVLLCPSSYLAQRCKDCIYFSNLNRQWQAKAVMLLLLIAVLHVAYNPSISNSKMTDCVQRVLKLWDNLVRNMCKKRFIKIDSRTLLGQIIWNASWRI